MSVKRICVREVDLTSPDDPVLLAARPTGVGLGARRTGNRVVINALCPE